MAKTPFSRRKFLGSLAAGSAIATAQFTPISGFGSPRQVGSLTGVERVDPDRTIKILSIGKFSDAEVRQIRSAAKNVDLKIFTDSRASEQLEEAEVIFGPVSAANLLAAKNLKWVQALGAGVENMPKALVDHPCILTNMQRIYAPVIAESAIGLLLSLTRGLTQVSIPAFRERKWANAPEAVVLDDLYHKTIGIVGMGGIGSETARRLHYGFGMKVLATDAKPMPKPEFVDELHDPGWLMEMVPKVDVLMSAAPLTNETREMFSEQVFRKMRSTAYFINVSRGGLVDQAALVSALKENRIRGAGLDVTTPEPLPPDHALWTCPNLVITPHNSGQAAIRQVRLMGLVTENVRRYSLGLPLLNVVDKLKGY